MSYSSQSRSLSINRDISSNSEIDETEREANEYEHLSGLSSEFSSQFLGGKHSAKRRTRIKVKRMEEEEKKQAIKIEQAAKQNALLAQPSNNRGGKNLRKKSARIAFILDEKTDVQDKDKVQDKVPTEFIYKQKSDKVKVSLKRAIRKPGHGERGKSVRFIESESTGALDL
jgi:hypothetical protein